MPVCAGWAGEHPEVPDPAGWEGASWEEEEEGEGEEERCEDHASWAAADLLKAQTTTGA